MAAHVYPYHDEFNVGYDFVTYTGVLFSEMHGSGAEEANATGGKITRIYRTPWKTRRAFINTLLGGTFSSGLGFYRLPPTRDSDWSWMYCDSASIQPFGRIYKGDANQALYKKGCIVNANFVTPTAENQPDEPSAGGGGIEGEIALVTESGDFSGEMLTQEGKGYYLLDDQNDEHLIQSPIGVMVVNEEYTYARHTVLTLPRNTIAATAGKVNGPLGTTFAGRDAERLLFVGAQYRRVTTAQGVKAYEITYKFNDRLTKTKRALTAGSDIRAAGIYAGWNRIWVGTINNYVVNDWVKVYNLVTDKPIYELADFSALFNPNAT